MHSFGSSLPESNFFQPPPEIGAQMNNVLAVFDEHDAGQYRLQEENELTAHGIMRKTQEFNKHVRNEKHLQEQRTKELIEQ